ncbi:NAC transcription factor 56 [Nymphaea colorata]|nr:NAC transcription factor 56 [Nymphaea colorata]
MNEVDKDEVLQQEQDLVMPGFRFHPTEEELVEFYLRRKMEGKRFSVELITFVDLYRYDPWELPALAAIGEKEWFFYVPRDRKYRNGDRPNRVTTSGYWKATGADRMIRNENLKPIGLKKTLVFYSGKAPKGIRSSWIMNEYRLPHHETERLQKAEISLCRVYKRPGGGEDRVQPPSIMPSTRLPFKKVAPSNSKESINILGGEKEEMPGRRQSVLGGRGDGNPSVAAVTAAAGMGGGGGRSNNAIGLTASGSLPSRANGLLACQIEIPAGTNQRAGDIFGGPAAHVDSLRLASCSSSAEAAATIKLQDQRDHVDGASGLLLRPRTLSFPLVHPAAIGGMQFASSSPPMAASLEEDIHRIVEYHHQCPESLSIFPNASHFQQSTSPQMALPSSLPSSLSVLAENPWTWNPIPDHTRDYRFRE